MSLPNLGDNRDTVRPTLLPSAFCTEDSVYLDKDCGFNSDIYSNTSYNYAHRDLGFSDSVGTLDEGVSWSPALTVLSSP